MTTLDPMGFSPLTETLQVLETASELNVNYSVKSWGNYLVLAFDFPCNETTHRHCVMVNKIGEPTVELTTIKEMLRLLALGKPYLIEEPA